MIPRRSPLVRHRTVRLHRGPRKDPVTPELRELVLRRDGECLMAKFNAAHVCRDAMGRPHAAWALSMLSIEHVKSDLAMGKRAPSDAAHCVALCHGANVAVPSKEARAFFREWLVTHPPGALPVREG